MDYARIPLKIERKELSPGIVVLMMSGPIRMGPHCKQIEEQVDKLIAAGEKRLVFDLSGVYNLDSSGLGQIVTCLSKLKQSGGFLRLAGVGGRCRPIGSGSGFGVGRCGSSNRTAATNR